MAKKKNTVTYTDKQIKKKLARGESRTDWKRVDATTEKELEAAIASDPDEAGGEGAGPWVSGIPPLPPKKQYVHIGLDEDMLGWFRSLGRGYQTRMNAILRQYYQAHHETAGARDRDNGKGKR